MADNGIKTSEDANNLNLKLIDKNFSTSVRLEDFKNNSRPKKSKDSDEFDIEDSSSETTASNSDLEDIDGIYIDAVPIANKNVNESASSSSWKIQVDDSIKSTQPVLNEINTPLKIDSVAVNNSSEVQIGNKTIFNGPTTVKIKQFILPKEKGPGGILMKIAYIKISINFKFCR
jgi:hypothetical protein